MLNIDELKVGDRVGIGGGYGGGKCEVKNVAKRTATQVVLEDGTRWNKSGRRIGDGGSYYRQFLMTEQEAIERNDEEARSKRAASSSEACATFHSVKYPTMACG